MESLNNYKIKASSLVESIIALVIVAVCLSIALVVYVNVLQSNRDMPFYRAEQKVKELFWTTKEQSLWEDEDYRFKTYSIQKKVESKNGLYETYKLTFTVHIANKKKSYEYVVAQ